MNEKKIEEFYEEMGQLIHDARIKKNYSQAKIAEEIGLSRASIVNIEKGRQRTPLHQLYTFAQILEIDVAELMPKYDPDLLKHFKRKKSRQVEKGNLKQSSLKKLESFIGDFNL